MAGAICLLEASSWLVPSQLEGNSQLRVTEGNSQFSTNTKQFSPFLQELVQAQPREESHPSAQVRWLQTCAQDLHVSGRTPQETLERGKQQPEQKCKGRGLKGLLFGPYFNFSPPELQMMGESLKPGYTDSC